MVDRCLLRLARTIHAHPRRISIVCLALAVLAAILVARIPITTDILDVMPENNPAIVAFTNFLRDFGLLNGLVIVVERRDAASDALIATVQALGERLSASPYVASADYNALTSVSTLIAAHFAVYLDERGIDQLSTRLSPQGIRDQIRRNREALLSPLGSPFEAEMIRLDPLNVTDLVQQSLRQRLPATSLDLSTGYYLDASHRLAFVMVRPRGSVRDMGFVRALERDVSRIATEALQLAGGESSIRIALAGGYPRAAEAISVIWRDMVISFAVSFGLVLLSLYLALRPSAIVLAIVVATLFVSLAWTLLLAYLLYGTLNIITSIVAAVLIGLFVDYIIHVYRRFQDVFRLEGGSLPALERTLTGTGKAILSSAITTSLSFFSVVVTSFRGLHELGVVAGVGILFCLAATLVLTTSLLVWLAKSRPAWLAAGRRGDLGEDRAARLVERRGRLLLAGFAVLLTLGLVGTARVRFETSLEAVGLGESAVQVAEDRVAQVLGRHGEPLFVVARARGEDALARDFDALERQGEQWRAAGTVGSFSSPGMLLPPPSRQEEAMRLMTAAGLSTRFTGPQLAGLLRLEMDRQGLAPDASLDSYAEGIVRALASRDVLGLPEIAHAENPRAAYYYNPAARAIAAHLTAPGPRWDRATLAALEEDVRRLGSDFRLVGPAVFLDEIRATILWDAGLAVALSFSANLLVVWLHFRRWRRVWLVMVPVTAGTILTVGVMGILGMPFNFFNVAGIALIFGFGVDYGIYLMQAHVEGGRSAGGGPFAVRSVGGSVVLCAITTIVSCGSLITSHYRGLASIGAVLSLGALFCLVSTLLFQPALLGRLDKVGRVP